MIQALIGVGEIIAVLGVVGLGLFAFWRFEQRKALPPPAPAPALAAEAETAPPAPTGPSPDLLAAVAIAVADYARDRRLQAAPHSRVYEPGSHLFASRWVAVGRGNQQHTWSRR
jgi:hypothetical protein